MKLDFITRIFETKKFLNENFHESVITIVRIYHFFHNILQRFIARDAEKIIKSSKRNEKHNLILKKHQISIVHDFIRSLLTYRMSFSKMLIFNAIRNLKLKENFDFQNSSKR